MLLIQPIVKALSSSTDGGNDGIHIVMQEDPTTDDPCWAVMFCGATCTITDDASLRPEGFDFYDPKAGEQATCKACKEAWIAAGCPQKTNVDWSE